MTSKLKCPFCGVELDEDTLGDFCCINPECKESICFSGSKLLWQALIQTKEELKDCQHNYSVKTEQHERGYAYSIKTIRDLESKLEIARKALESISGVRGNIEDYYGGVSIHYQQMVLHMDEIATNALEQIEHKE